jgi:hypothetical protein
MSLPASSTGDLTSPFLVAREGNARHHPEGSELAGPFLFAEELPKRDAAAGAAVARSPLPPTVVDPFPSTPYVVSFDKGNSSLNSAFARIAADPDLNRMCAAVVDLTDSPAQPAYAGMNDDEMLYVGSLQKICLLYVAFELRHRVRLHLQAAISAGYSTAQPGWERALLEQLQRAWAPILEATFPHFPKSHPQLSEIFSFATDGSVNFRGSASIEDLDRVGEFGSVRRLGFLDCLRLALRWSNNAAAGRCILALSHPYLNGALEKAGLFDRGTGIGMWLSGSYVGRDWAGASRALTARWASAQREPSRRDGKSNFVSNAGAPARLLTLLVRGGLIDSPTCVEMRNLLTAAISISGHTGIGSYVNGALAAASRAPTRVLSKIGFGDDARSHDCAIVERTLGAGNDIRYAVVGLGSIPKNRTHLSRLFVALDQAVAALHPAASVPPGSTPHHEVELGESLAAPGAAGTLGELSPEPAVKSRLASPQLTNHGKHLQDRLNACLAEDRAHIVPGERGDHVRIIQAAMETIRTRQPGLNLPKITDAAGHYGPTTAAAVLKYKGINGIIRRGQPLDAIVGRMTLTRIDDELLNTEPPPRIAPIVIEAATEIATLADNLSKNDLEFGPAPNAQLSGEELRLIIDMRARSTAELVRLVRSELERADNTFGRMFVDAFVANVTPPSAAFAITHGVGSSFSQFVSATRVFQAHSLVFRTQLDREIKRLAGAGPFPAEMLRGRVPPPTPAWGPRGLAELSAVALQISVSFLPFTAPEFTAERAKMLALVGSFQGSRVFLHEFRMDMAERKYLGTLFYELTDHFGIDTSDLHFDTRGHGTEGQVALWVLQRERHTPPGNMPYRWKVVIREELTGVF